MGKLLVVYPCRCLWRGLLHTTNTTPRRRTTLHLSQIRLTLALTFMALARVLAADWPQDSPDKWR
jgi:hypothetical protein